MVPKDNNRQNSVFDIFLYIVTGRIFFLKLAITQFLKNSLSYLFIAQFDLLKRVFLLHIGEDSLRKQLLRNKR